MNIRKREIDLRFIELRFWEDSFDYKYKISIFA